MTSAKLELAPDLCSTDSGTSYSSAGSATSDPRHVPQADPRRTNLNFFHDFASIDSLSGSFTKRKSLSSCCRGEGQIELHEWSGRRDDLVVVKKLPAGCVNVNKGLPGSEQELFHRTVSRSSEDTLSEIGVFGYLRQCENLPQYILEMLFAFQVDQEIWLVLEHADGGDLFSVISSQQPSKELLLLWAWQLLQAVAFLHKQGICHRDISLENVLLCGGDVRLMDFGQAVRSHHEGQLLRYFLATGKPYYRPPETYIPTAGLLEVVLPPGTRAGQVTLATSQDYLCHVRVLDADAKTGEPYGYTAPPVDVFASAVCILIMFFAAPPWRQARPSDSYFQWVQSHGLSALARSWKKVLPPAVLDLLNQMLITEAERRPAVLECLDHSCFSSFRSAPVALRDRLEVPEVPRLAGDCYREPEWVCRAAEVTEVFGAEMWLGDPYRDDMPCEEAYTEEEVPCAPPVLPLLREDQTEILALDAPWPAHAGGEVAA